MPWLHPPAPIVHFFFSCFSQHLYFFFYSLFIILNIITGHLLYLWWLHEVKVKDAASVGMTCRVTSGDGCMQVRTERGHNLRPQQTFLAREANLLMSGGTEMKLLKLINNNWIKNYRLNAPCNKRKKAERWKLNIHI